MMSVLESCYQATSNVYVGVATVQMNFYCGFNFAIDRTLEKSSPRIIQQ